MLPWGFMEITEDNPKPSRWEGLSLVSGIVFAVLQLGVLVYFVVFVFPKLGPMDASATVRASAYTQHGETLRLGNYLMTLPAVFLLFFLNGLYAVLRRLEGGSGLLAIATMASGIAMSMLWPLSAVVSDIAIDIAKGGGDAATVAAFGAIGPYTLALSALPRTVLLVATSLVLLDPRFAYRWIGWAGFGVAFLSIVGTTTLVFKEMFAVLACGTVLFEFWILAVSIALLRHREMVRRMGRLGMTPVVKTGG